MPKRKAAYHYEVIGVPGDGKRYKLGFTSNKWAFQRNSGWPMSELRFVRKAGALFR